MVLKGAERYGEYFVNAADFNHLLNEFLVSINLDRFIFAAFLSQIKKHYMLAFFSTVRLHHTQAMMNMRQVLEAGACAAYAIANTNPEDFADIDDQGIINPSDNLTTKRYQWLKTNYKNGSDAIKNMKDSINSSTAHSNIIYAHTNFNFDDENGKFNTPFFDFEDKYRVQIDLWTSGNVIMNLMDLFYGVNKERDVIKFTDNFIARLKALEKQNEKLKNDLMQNDRYKTIQKN